MLARIRSVVVVSDAPPAAPSFLSQEKRWGEKRVLGDALGVFRYTLGEALFFRHRSTRDSPYGRLGTRRLIRGIRFVTSCRRISAIHRRCRPSLLVCTFLRGVFLVFEHQKPSPMRGRWHGGAVTDEVGHFHLCGAVHLISCLRLTASPHRGSHWPARRYNLSGFPLHLLLTAVILRQPAANPTPPYQAARS